VKHPSTPSAPGTARSTPRRATRPARTPWVATVAATAARLSARWTHSIRGMSAPYPNNARPAGGQIIGVYFSAEEKDLLEREIKRTGEKRNAIIRRIVRESLAG
jgi:hypothetical protein